MQPLFIIDTYYVTEIKSSNTEVTTRMERPHYTNEVRRKMSPCAIYNVQLVVIVATARLVNSVERLQSMMALIRAGICTHTYLTVFRDRYIIVTAVFDCY